MTVPNCIIDMVETRTILRTVEAQIVQKLKNNEARPKFTASYKKVPAYYRLHFKNN